MNVLDKVFKGNVFNKEEVPSFYRCCYTKVGQFALFFCIFEGYCPMFMKNCLLETKI